jgi:membrane associated rhomboid family serine protease
VAYLIAANIACWFLQALTGDWVTRNFALVPTLVQYGEIWRLFTYQFLHAGVLHLALNMFMLWMFGSELAPRWGTRFFLRYYFLCGVGGGLAFTLVRFGTWDMSVGASGAIFGILIAYAMWYPNRQAYILFFGPFRVRYVVGFLILLDLAQAMQSSRTGIAHAAHLGGAGVGYAYLRWKGVDGFRPFSPATIKRWRRQYDRLRLRKQMRDRGWNDRDTLH